jgi:hypothetical protein
MSISRRSNRALNRVLREALRSHRPAEPQPEAAKPGAPAYTICADIPENYNDAYVRAIPKDPQNTFVYWELPKGLAEGSLLADKGTAHVENGEAVRIGEQLRNRQQRLSENQPNADCPAATGNRSPDPGSYDRAQEHPRTETFAWDNPDNGNQRQHYYQNHYCQENHYREDHYRENCHQENYCRENHRGDNHHNGNYCKENYYQENYYPENYYQESYCRDNYHPVNGDNRNCDRPAFSEMLSALIFRCNRHIADCRQGAGVPLGYAMSSGLLCAAGAGGLRP